MRLATRLGSLSAIVASLSLIAGCAGGSSQIPASGSGLLQHKTSQPVQTMSVNRSLLTTRVSMIAPAAVHAAPAARIHGACTTKPKFVSDYGLSEIYLYSGTTLCGTITGLSNPQGMNINDGNGYLYVANTGASDVLVFKPPYTGAPVKTISDPGYYPTDVTLCKNYIAITNIISTSGGAGNVEIYQSGKLTALQDKNAFEEYFAACNDANGDLFTDGRNSSGATIVNEFVGGKAPAKELPKIAAAVSFPGGMRFVKALWVDDQNQQQISHWAYPYNREGTVTKLSGASDPVTFAISPNLSQLLTADAGLDEGVLYSSKGAVEHTLAPGESGGTLIGAQFSANP